MKKYKMISNTVIFDTQTGMSIPLIEGNRHYEEFKQWIAEGNTPDPMDTPIVGSDNHSEVALKAQIKENIERGEYAEAIQKMAKLLNVN